MRELLVLAGERSSTVSCGDVAVWDRLDVPEGQISVPGALHARLRDIRGELVAWVFDLGRLSVDGVAVQERLKAGDDLSMWWCSLLFEKHPKVTPDLWPALKLRALELLVEEGGYEGLALAGGDARLARALETFCAATGRAFRRCDSGSRRWSAAVTRGLAALRELMLRSALRRLYYALPGPCKALGRFLVWLGRERRLLPRTSRARPAVAHPGSIASYFPNVDAAQAAAGRFRSRYWESLHDALQPRPGEAHRVNWVFVGFPSPQYSLEQCLALRDTFREQGLDGASFHYLEEFLESRDIRAALFRYARLALAGRRMQPQVRRQFHFAGSRMDLWPYLGRYWKDSFGGWRCLERCLQRRAFQRYVAWAGPQDWTIFPMENCPWERMLTEAVHAAGAGPVYGAQHSTVRPTDFRYFDDPRTFEAPDTDVFQPDRLFGNGQGAYDEMIGAGMPEARLGIVEALRYMYLAGRERRTVSVAERRLLVVTSFFADEVDEHLRVLADAARAGALDGWRVTVKPHPYLGVEERLSRLFPDGRQPDISTAPIGEMLTPGTVVWASNSTTVALEAAVLGLAVMVQMPADDVDLCPLQGVPGVARIASAADAAAFLAAPAHAAVPEGYLALEPALPRWRHVLGLLPGRA